MASGEWPVIVSGGLNAPRSSGFPGLIPGRRAAYSTHSRRVQHATKCYVFSVFVIELRVSLTVVTCYIAGLYGSVMIDTCGLQFTTIG